MDPAIAEAMGFSAFGGQGKKRKFTTDNAFVDPGASGGDKATVHASSGANNTPLRIKAGHPKGKATGTIKTNDQAPEPLASVDREEDQPGSTGNVDDGEGGEAARLQALRGGVKNERGDTVYFLPSFIEDPWQKLKSV